MNPLDRQVTRARRRLTVQRFLKSLCGLLFVFMLSASGMILANWQWSWGLPPVAVVGASAVLALVVAVAFSIAFRASRMDAAIELDRRYGLKERVSSTLSMEPSEQATPAGQALAADATRRVEQVNVRERFGLRLDRWALLPIVPAVLAFLLAYYLPRLRTPDDPPPGSGKTVEAKVIHRKLVEARKKELARKRDEAAKLGLKQLEDVYKVLHEDADPDENKLKPDDAVRKLNNLADELEKRRGRFDASDAMKRHLEDLKQLGDNTPGDTIANALKDGDFKKAIAEMEKLAADLKEGKLTPQQQQQLAERLDEVREKLESMVAEHDRKKRELEQKIDQAKARGDKAEAEKLQRQLDQLAQRDESMKQVERMAQQMGECAKCLGQGEPEKAMAGLKGMQGELENLARQAEEMQMLDEALEEIARSKKQVLEQQFGRVAGGAGKGNNRGDGLGEGQGAGFRPEKKDGGEKFVDSNVPGQLQPKGTFGQVGLTDGPNTRGKIREFISGLSESTKSQGADAVNGRRIPKPLEDQVRDYNDRLNK